MARPPIFEQAQPIPKWGLAKGIGLTGGWAQQLGGKSLAKPNQNSLSAAYLAYANRPRKANASSKYRGVSFLQGKGQWKAQLYWRGKRYFLGFFNSEIEAAESYNRHARLIIGPLAPINDASPGDSYRHRTP